MSDFKAIMERIAEEFPPAAQQQQYSDNTHEGSGAWDSDTMEDWLRTMGEHHSWFSHEKTNRRDGWRIYCPGNTPEGWPDGATHSEFYSLPNDSSIVYVENGWPCLSCKHNGCNEGAKEGRKSFRHLLDALDPQRELFDYPHVDSGADLGELLGTFSAEYDDVVPESTEAKEPLSSSGGTEVGKTQGYTYRRDDTGNAERLVRRFGDHIRFIFETGEWMVWTSNGWQKDTNGKLMRMTKAVIREISDQAMAGEDIDKALMEHSRKSAQRDRRKAMIELASSEKGICTNFADWDADKWLLNVRNGVIDLRTQTFRERKQTDLCMRQANVHYDPDARCPQWDAALLKYMNGDQSMVDFLARYTGYSLTGVCDAQSLIFNMGDGNNGKDTFTSAIAYMMGTYAADAAFETFAESKNHSEHRNDLAVLAGAVRFLTSCEGSDGHSLDEGVIKRVTGQSPVTVRHIHGKPFTYFPEYKLWFSSNYEPAIKGQDIGIWRRVKRVPWDYTITEAEKVEGFGDLLKKEAPSILNWALRGLGDYVKAGKMIYHPKIDQATAQYRADMDIVGRFLRERCAMRSEATALGSNLYRAYADWCRANGFYAANSRKFYGELRKRMAGRVMETPSKNGAVFHGLGLLADGGYPMPTDVM